MYTCICLDSITHTTVCKHIHFIHKSRHEEHQEISKDSIEKTCTNNDIKWDNQYFTTILGSCSSKTQNILLVREQATVKASQLSALISDCTSTDTLIAAMAHLNSAIGIMNALSRNYNTESLPKVKSICPNANKDKQLSFNSTRKKRSTQKKSITKPSHEDYIKAKKTLIASAVTICGICLQEEDRSDDTTVEWIECTKCGIWIHTYCCKTKISDKYICTNCSDYA